MVLHFFDYVAPTSKVMIGYRTLKKKKQSHVELHVKINKAIKKKKYVSDTRTHCYVNSTRWPLKYLLSLFLIFFLILFLLFFFYFLFYFYFKFFKSSFKTGP